jgi:hypothetical protein
MNEENSPLNEKAQANIQAEQKSETSLDVTSLPAADDSEDQGETSVLDEQWAVITQDWQTQPVQETDVVALLKQTKRRMLWAKVFLTLNVIAVVGIFIYFIIGLSQGDLGTPMNTYLGMSGLVMTIFVYYEIKIRLQTWRQCCDSPDKAIDNAIAACQSSIKYMILNKLACIPFTIMGNWFVVVMAFENDKPIWTGLIFVNVILITIYIVSDKFHKKRKEEYQRLSALK